MKQERPARAPSLDLLHHIGHGLKRIGVGGLEGSDKVRIAGHCHLAEEAVVVGLVPHDSSRQ